MRTAALFRTTAILIATALATFASARSECAAQTGTGSEQKRLSPSAAIEEARQSPFHAGATVAAPWRARAEDAGTGETGSFHLTHPEQEAEHPMNAFGFVATVVLAELSHFAVVYSAYGCRSDACYLLPILPLPVVALPAMAGGVAPGRALGASGIGLLGGAAAYLLSGYITEQVSNFSIFGSALVSGLVHAVITVALVRPR